MKYLYITTCLFVGFISTSQEILDRYIDEGLANNQSIREHEIAYEKSVFALKEAKSLFLPSIAFMADYFMADGGRTVDFPAGDLLNPVYNSLNELTNSSSFPLLQNQRILLNPDNFYDVKLRTSLPLFNIELTYNKQIKKEQISMREIELALYKRELVKEIKLAYFSYLQSIKNIEIYTTVLENLFENKRVNESLYANDKVNKTVVLRSENEILKYEALKTKAENDSNSARAFFNFLLNKELNTPVSLDQSYQLIADSIENSSNLALREELQQLKVASAISQQAEKLAASYIIPKINTFLDLGSQGFDWQYNNNTQYYFFGVSLQWDLFSGGKNKHKIKLANLDGQLVQSQMEYLTAQLQLQFITAINNYATSKADFQSAALSLATSQAYYSDILQLYKQGQALYIELLEAQNQWVQAELQLYNTLYETHKKAAEIERATASFNLNKE